MNILSNLFTAKTSVGFTDMGNVKELLRFSTNNYSDSEGENISTIYTSCKILADDIGSFPLNLYLNDNEGGKTIIKDDYRYGLLHYNPNKYTTSNTFFSTLEYIRNIKGNAFARINRDNTGFVTSLTIVPPSKITGYSISNNELYYKFKEDKGADEKLINASEILHFRSLSDDGIWGINPIEKLRLNLSVTSKAFKTIDKFYDNNATSPKALKTTIPEGINPKDWQKKVDDFNAKYASPDNSGKTIVLPPFTELQDLTLNFADAEFISTIRFNADQIAALYKVPPHMLGNFESSKFNNLEQLQLNYKINTLRPIMRIYRQELEFKLLTNEERIKGVSIEFNANAIVETDSKTRIENMKSLFGMGVMSPNDICKMEGMPAYNGGDDHFLLTQLMSVEAYNKKNQNSQTQI